MQTEHAEDELFLYNKNNDHFQVVLEVQPFVDEKEGAVSGVKEVDPLFLADRDPSDFPGMDVSTLIPERSHTQDSEMLHPSFPDVEISPLEEASDRVEHW